MAKSFEVLEKMSPDAWKRSERLVNDLSLEIHLAEPADSVFLLQHGGYGEPGYEENAIGFSDPPVLGGEAPASV
jgi:hypothetical protein